MTINTQLHLELTSNFVM